MHNFYKQHRTYLLHSFILIGVFFSGFTTLFIFGTVSQAKNITASVILATKTTATSSIDSNAVVMPSPAPFFQNLNLQAKAAYVYNPTTGQVIYAKNENLALPYASLTKVMTMLVAEETVPSDTVVPITQTALDQDGGGGLVLNEQWRLKDLMDYSLIVSSNTGAEAIAETTDEIINRQSETDLPFKDYMNQEALKIGMANTTYSNSNGLDIDTANGVAGAYGSAKDMATLLLYVIKNHPDEMEMTKYNQRSFTSLSGMTHVANNTDLILNQIPNVIASKTGYTLLAGGNLAIVFDAGLNEPIVMVVLGSTEDGRFTDMLALASLTQAYLLTTPPMTASTTVTN